MAGAEAVSATRNGHEFTVTGTPDDHSSNDGTGSNEAANGGEAAEEAEVEIAEM